MSEEAAEKLKRGLAQLGIPFGSEQLDRMRVFLEELQRWTRRHGLVGRRGGKDRQIDRGQLIVRHVLDSLAAWETIAAFEHRSRIADVGSGAGFPGIPLAVFLPDSRFTLLEPSSTKAAFLRNALILAGVENAEVAETRVEQVRRRFDLVVFRAFSPLSRVLPDIRRIVEPGGAILAYKGKLSRIEEEIRSSGLVPQDLRIVALRVPFLEEQRHLVVVPTASGAS
jgi:16S rRNA (guanine527-N7)-methyltransferase